MNSLLYHSGCVWSGSSDKSIRLWNVRTGNLIRQLHGHSGWVWCLLAVGKEQVWSGSGDKSIRIWQAKEVPLRYDLSPAGTPMRPQSAGAGGPNVSPIRSPYALQQDLNASRDTIRQLEASQRAQEETVRDKLLEKEAELADTRIRFRQEVQQMKVRRVF